MTEAENYRSALDLGPGTVLACPVPLHHAYGFGLAALAAPLAGATTLVTGADRPRMLLRALDTMTSPLSPACRRCCDCWPRRPPRGRSAGSATYGGHAA